MKVTVCRKSHFNAAHRLYNPKWDMAQNDAVFGKCNNPNFHGHNYTIEVWLTGEVDPETGMVIDLKILKDLIESEIEERFDHKNLNMDTTEFKNLFLRLKIFVLSVGNYCALNLIQNFSLK
jgi:6-pyruvoyltetrahydropterin/6-carboxytetrahydropterin synthase